MKLTVADAVIALIQVQSGGIVGDIIVGFSQDVEYIQNKMCVNVPKRESLRGSEVESLTRAC